MPLGQVREAHSHLVEVADEVLGLFLLDELAQQSWLRLTSDPKELSTSKAACLPFSAAGGRMHS